MWNISIIIAYNFIMLVGLVKQPIPDTEHDIIKGFRFCLKDLAVVTIVDGGMKTLHLISVELLI